MKPARTLLVLGAASLGQVLLSRYLPVAARLCDFLTILVVYYGLTRPAMPAMLMGSAAGLAEDVLLGSVLGLNGFKKTLIGYLVGTIGSLFMLNQPIPRFGILFAATLADPLMEWALSAALGMSFGMPGPVDLLQRGLGNGVVGLLIFALASRVQ